MTSSEPTRSWSITVITSSVSSGKDTVSSNTLEDTSQTYKDSGLWTVRDVRTEQNRGVKMYWLSECGVELFGDVSVFGVKTLLSNTNNQVRISFTIWICGSQTRGLREADGDNRKNCRIQNTDPLGLDKYEPNMVQRGWCLTVFECNNSVKLTL